ncbi:MAG: HAMP domain-containing sensor histidine kinase [Clostridiaceae bacterium]|nr:HAMP domain-containing histidine kinase [Eubacteriales bacterium]
MLNKPFGKYFGSIRTRMVLIYLAVTVFTMVATSVVVSAIMGDFLVSQRTKTQLKETSQLALEITPELLSGNSEQLFSFITARAQTMGGRVLVLDTDAVVQADSASQQNGYWLPYREVRDILTGGAETSYGFHRIVRTMEDFGILGTSDEQVWAVYYTAPITVSGVYKGVILFSALIQDVQNSVSDVIGKIVMVFVAVAVITAAISFMLSGWLTKPVVELTGAIRRMGTKGYGVRVDVKGGGEMAELGNAFNRMSERIEEHDKVRDEFIANASHELKTPLSSMKLLSESILYQNEPDPAIMKEFFQDVNHEVDRLSNIITDLLRLVQDDAERSELDREPTRLDTLVLRTVNRLRPLASKKGILLQVRTEPVVVPVEPMRIEQVVTNLVENAIKYTDAGSVIVHVSQEQTDAVFSVKDTGIGIPQEALLHLFERFYRVDKARSRGTGGTGLGLAIANKIVTMHGGYIEVESVLGKGSVFTVRLPFAPICDDEARREKRQ